MKSLTRPLLVLFVLSSLIALTAIAAATTESLNVQAGADVIRTIDVVTDDRVTVKFSAVGESPNTLHFWVQFANGTSVDFGEVGGRMLSFATDTSGQFIMHFDNSNSPSSKLVTLNYEVEHYYFGIPSVLFIIVAITVLLVGVVAGYIIMGKYS